MIEVLKFAWEAIKTAGKLLQFEGVLKFLVELFTDISPYTKRYNNFVNGAVILTDYLGKFKKTITFTDVYDMHRQMFEYIKGLQFEEKEKDAATVRDLILNNDEYGNVKNFECFLEEDLYRIKGLHKYTFVVLLTQQFIEDDEGEVIIKIVNFMIECAVNRFCK